MYKINIPFFLLFLLGTACSSDNNNTTSVPHDDEPKNTISRLEFIDEFIISEQNIDNIPIGGFSGIDYNGDIWYLISDSSSPARYYTANIVYNQNEFTSISLNKMIVIKDASGNPIIENTIDPESIRYDITSQSIIYTSEGIIANGISPSLYKMHLNGKRLQTYSLPDNFKANTSNGLTGPRHNGTLEGLCTSFDKNGYWIGMELPLIEDGASPTITDTESPVRITKINKISTKPEYQFAYELDAVDRKPTLGTDISLNGLTELIEYNENQFLVLERSFSSGYLDGGNTVKIYKVDATNATNTLSMSSLAGKTYTKATKTLLFKFDDIRNKLTFNIVGNIEGITFGPTLPDGSKSLIAISDNNFNRIFPQLNQLILFKVIP